MGKITDFYHLDAWKENHSIVLMIYEITRSFPKEEKYGLINQIRRAAASVTANIAEGFGRYHFSDKVRFYHQARGSVKEVQNFLYLAKDLGYLKEKDAKNIWRQSKKGERLLNGLIKSIEKQKE
jgi:four helix bundle protein